MHRKPFVASALFAVALLLAASPLAAQITRYVHFQQGATTGWGVLEGETIQRLDDAPYLGGTRTGQTVALSAVTLLPPATPKTAVIVNVNYPSGVTGTQRDHPTIITLPPRALVGSGSAVMRPAEAEDVRAEPTVAVVIGRTASRVSAAEAGQYIFGVVPALDVTAVDWRPRGSQWTRAKGADTFKPVGPYLVTGIEHDNLTITGRVGGASTEPVSTGDMIWGFDELIEYVSRYMTLEPGDIVFAGTAGERYALPIQAGQTVEVDVRGLGTLRSPVAAAPSVAATLPPPFRRQ